MLLLGLLAFGTLDHAAAQGGKLYPVDEASKDPSFKTFMDKLLTAVRRHDPKFILNILDPEVENDLGGSRGVKEFEKKWQPVDRPDSELWNVLRETVSLGGTFMTSEGQTGFCAPYVYTRWPHEFDAFKNAAIVKDKVELRVQPLPTARVIATLSYDIVKVDREHSVPDKTRRDIYLWVKVATPNGTEGYVPGDCLRTPIDYRACFKKVKGKWRMTALITGD
jgi:hypothetical protein